MAITEEPTQWYFTFPGAKPPFQMVKMGQVYHILRTKEGLKLSENNGKWSLGMLCALSEAEVVAAREYSVGRFVYISGKSCPYRAVFPSTRCTTKPLVERLQEDTTQYSTVGELRFDLGEEVVLVRVGDHRGMVDFRVISDDQLPPPKAL